MKKKKWIFLSAALAVLVIAGVVLAVVLLGGGDGDTSRKARASGMWLVKAEGGVAVTDDEGEDVPVKALPGMDLRLTLRSGYAVGTESASYGWVDLDDERFAKLDESSLARIRKSGRELEIEVSEGALYFNVKKPLRDDETMEIRSSSMVMAIRGTSGWVRASDDETFDVYIIDGTVQCTAGDEEKSVTAGEHARLSVREDAGSVTVEPFSEEDIPAFVMEEAREDEDLREELSALGVTVGPDTPDGPEDPTGPDDPDGPDTGSEGTGKVIFQGSYGDVSWEIVQVVPELTQELPEVYYQKPVFYGDGAGIPEINSIYEQQAASFASSRSGSHSTGYESYYNVSVSQPMKGFVCVSQSFYEYDGMIHPYSGNYHATYDLETGRELTLMDVVDGTEEEIRALIKQELDKTEYAGQIQYSSFDIYSLDIYDFEITETGVALHVDYDTLGLGSGGRQSSLTVTLPLSTRYRGPAQPEPGTGKVIATDDVTWEIETVRPQLTHNVPQVYYEKPVLSGGASGIQTINQFFESEASRFLNQFSDLDARLDAPDGPEAESYTEAYTVKLTMPTEGLLCVEQYWSEFNSRAVHPFSGVNYYVFDLATGDKLSPKELLGGTDDQIRAAIEAELRTTQFAQFYNYSIVQKLDIDSLDLLIEDGKAKLTFLLSNLGIAASGSMTVDIYLPLSDRYGG